MPLLIFYLFIARGKVSIAKMLMEELKQIRILRHYDKIGRGEPWIVDSMLDERASFNLSPERKEAIITDYLKS
ncbi:hypothetical protein [Legionella parisiensis]|uniref:hypothetical protein n=1 Tax=Legionella parisiensis TaxID=45071 RepID=UPI00072FC47E|nr:hypothetical protein [Legionella parisiensis]